MPLQFVNVLNSEAQAKLRQQQKRLHRLSTLLLALVYLLMMGGLITLTVFLADVLIPALALAMLLAALGILASIFHLWSGVRFWLLVSCLFWPAA